MNTGVGTGVGTGSMARENGADRTYTPSPELLRIVAETGPELLSPRPIGPLPISNRDGPNDGAATGWGAPTPFTGWRRGAVWLALLFGAWGVVIAMAVGLIEIAKAFA